MCPLCDSASGYVETILGTTNSIVKDTTVTKSKRQIKKDEQKEVHLYLAKNDDRDIEDGGGVEIAQNDIQRAQMQGRKFKVLLGIIVGAMALGLGCSYYWLSF